MSLREGKDFEEVYCSSQAKLGVVMTPSAATGSPVVVCVNSMAKIDKIGHFQVPKNLTFKARLSAKPLIWKWFLIMMQIKLIFTTKISHLDSFWKWDFLELGDGLSDRSELD